MTDTEPDTEPEPTPDPEVEPEPDPEVDDEPTDEVATLRDEAARRRIEARDAVERADALAARLTESTVATATADVMADPTDFARFHDGPVPVDDDGYPDAAAIRAAAEAIVEGRPHLAARKFAPIDAGPQGDGTPAPSTILGALRSAG